MKRFTILFLFVAAHLFAQKPSGVNFPRLLYFPDVGNTARLLIQFRSNDLLAGNDCATAAECEKLYRLEYREAYHAIAIDKVISDLNAGTLTATLDTPVTDIKALFFVGLNVKATPKIGYVEIPVKPQLLSLEVPETESFEGFSSPAIVQYQTLTPVTLKTDDKTRATISSDLAITDPNDFDRPYRGYIVGIVPETNVVDTLTISGAPRGKKVNIQVGGIETFNGSALSATTAVQTLSVPKGRDDATLFLRVAADANDIKHERKYTLDVRAHDAWRAGDRWQIGPTLDATIGNKTAKAPNTASLAADFRYFIPGSDVFRSRLLLSPIFRADRDFKNEDLGADFAFEMIIPHLDKSLDVRRKKEKNDGGPPLALLWGWSVRPVVAIEAGRHMKSSEPEVDGTEFTRLRGGLAVTLERERWKLAVSAVRRHLSSNEVVVDSGSVVATSKSDRGFVRSDLSYDIGTVGLTLTHMNGRQPPAFSATHSTSLGVTFKY